MLARSVYVPLAIRARVCVREYTPLFESRGEEAHFEPKVTRGPLAFSSVSYSLLGFSANQRFGTRWSCARFIFAVERPEVASSMSLKVVKAAQVHPLPPSSPHPVRPARPIVPVSGLTRPAVREHAPAPLPNYHHHLVPNDRLRTRGSLSQNPSFRVGREGWRGGEGEGVSVCGSNCLLLRSRAARSPSALCGSVGRIGVPSCGVRSDAQ